MKCRVDWHRNKFKTSLGTYPRLVGNLSGISWDRYSPDTCTSLDLTLPPPWCADTSCGDHCESVQYVGFGWWHCDECWESSKYQRAPTRPTPGKTKFTASNYISTKLCLNLNPKRDLYRTQSAFVPLPFKFSCSFPFTECKKLENQITLATFLVRSSREKTKNWSRNDIKMSSRKQAREKRNENK